MSAHVKSLGFASHNGGGKPITHIKEHIKYIEADREHHRSQPELFNQDHDHVDRKEFFQKLNEQPHRGVVGHKLVITISEDEQQKYGTDMKTLVRDTMNRFELKHDVRLDWVASVHDDKDHPHAHVVVRGYNEDGKQVGIYPSHIKDLQKFADQEKQRQFERQPEQRNLFREMEQEREQTRSLEKSLEQSRDLEMSR